MDCGQSPGGKGKFILGVKIDLIRYAEKKLDLLCPRNNTKSNEYNFFFLEPESIALW